MTPEEMFEQWNDLLRRMLLNRLTEDAEGRRVAMVVLGALVKDDKLVEILPRLRAG